MAEEAGRIPSKPCSMMEGLWIPAAARMTGGGVPAKGMLAPAGRGLGVWIPVATEKTRVGDKRDCGFTSRWDGRDEGWARGRGRGGLAGYTGRNWWTKCCPAGSPLNSWLLRQSGGVGDRQLADVGGGKVVHRRFGGVGGVKLVDLMLSSRFGPKVRAAQRGRRGR